MRRPRGRRRSGRALAARLDIQSASTGLVGAAPHQAQGPSCIAIPSTYSPYEVPHSANVSLDLYLTTSRKSHLVSQQGALTMNRPGEFLSTRHLRPHLCLCGPPSNTEHLRLCWCMTTEYWSIDIRESRAMPPMALSCDQCLSLRPRHPCAEMHRTFLWCGPSLMSRDRSIALARQACAMASCMRCI